VIDLHASLCYLGVLICDKSFVFGDNRSMVDSATILHSKLHKPCNALSFNHVHEAIAAKHISMYHLSDEFNPADILTKHWGYPQVWRLLQPLLFYQGDTTELFHD
jgi:hypothetical protein